ncbi:hypothetical protein N7474_007292 [Penicillium riverlandense]|uniref:uncharacterized protein n=1 Tax=Penicillium riverlandense TaxID=1903569 RepID=UPI002546F3A3|nr:uncharacterized protein N7474_007292 [Penicillium riverlandense]KAJ5815515.1 hypothetical protein N7474_007292 [Penicillium riverlandense]
MPSIRLHPRPSAPSPNNPKTPTHSIHNPLPPLLQTPTGLALLELQGTINLPTFPDSNSDSQDDASSPLGPESESSSSFETPVGKLMFPNYRAHTAPDDTKWMKRAYLYVGRYQRMTGEVKKLPRPIAVVQKRTGTGVDQDELEVVEVVRFKIVFQSRPEPVNDV